MDNRPDDEKGTVSGWMHRFMEEHAKWFWVLYSVLIVLVIYKAFSLTFLEKTPYSWDYAFHHITLALLSILMMREAYRGEFHMGFRGKGFWKGLVMCWPALVFLAVNLAGSLCIGRVYPESLIQELVKNVSIGLFEEVVVRAVLVGHMMHYWRNSPRRVFNAVLWSSVLFGVLHIGNALAAPLNTAFQIFYATGFGIIFAAVYIRTRNLWSCILVHALVDFTGSLTLIYLPLQPDYEAYGAAAADLTYLVPSVAPDWLISGWGLIAILGLLLGTALSVAVGIYELRKAKAEETALLWEKM